jgi:hypothetical protein
MMKLDIRRSVIQKSCGRQKLEIDLAKRAFPLSRIEPTVRALSRNPHEELGGSRSNAQIIRTADVMLLHRTQRLQ